MSDFGTGPFVCEINLLQVCYLSDAAMFVSGGHICQWQPCVSVAAIFVMFVSGGHVCQWWPYLSVAAMFASCSHLCPWWTYLSVVAMFVSG